MPELISLFQGFAGLLAAKLTELKIISLEDPVSKFIPELTLEANTIDRELRIKNLILNKVLIRVNRRADVKKIYLSRKELFLSLI
jgi:hypothetical protein